MGLSSGLGWARRVGEQEAADRRQQKGSEHIQDGAPAFGVPGMFTEASGSVFLHFSINSLGAAEGAMAQWVPLLEGLTIMVTAG